MGRTENSSRDLIKDFRLSVDGLALAAFAGSALLAGSRGVNGFWGVSLLAMFWFAAWAMARSMFSSRLLGGLWILSLIAWPGLWPTFLGNSAAAASAIVTFLAAALLFRARRKRAPGFAWVALLALFLAVRWTEDAFLAVIPFALLWGQVIAKLFPSARLSRQSVGVVAGVGVTILIYGAGSASFGLDVPAVPPLEWRESPLFKGWFYLTWLIAAAIAHVIRRREDRWTGFVLAVLASGLLDLWMRVGGGSLYNTKVFLWPALTGWIGAALLLRQPER